MGLINVRDPLNVISICLNIHSLTSITTAQECHAWYFCNPLSYFRPQFNYIKLQSCSSHSWWGFSRPSSCEGSPENPGWPKFWWWKKKQLPLASLKENPVSPASPEDISMGCSEVVINNQAKIRVSRSWLLLVDEMYFASTWRLCQAKMSSLAPTGPLNVIESGFVYSPSQLFLPAPVALWLLFTSWVHAINPKGFTKCSICFGTFLYLGISGRYLSNVYLWWFDNKALLTFYSTVVQ